MTTKTKQAFLCGAVCLMLGLLPGCTGETARENGAPPAPDKTEAVTEAPAAKLSFIDESIQPLSLPLERHVHIAEEKPDVRGNRLYRRYTTLRCPDYKSREMYATYPKLFVAFDVYDTGETHANTAEWSNMWQRAANLRQSREADGLPIDGLYQRCRDLFIRRADTLVFSFLERNDHHDLGPSLGLENISYYGRNLDTATGKYLTLADVFTDIDDLSKAIEAQLRQDYPDANFTRSNTKLDIAGHLQAGEKALTDRMGGAMAIEAEEGLASWTLEARGATFYFNAPLLGPMRDGTYATTILFEEHPELFREEYRRGPAEYCMDIVPELPTRVILPGGRSATVGTYVQSSGLYVTCGPANRTLPNEPTTSITDANPVLVGLADGRYFLYAACILTDRQHDRLQYHDLHILDLNGHDIKDTQKRHWGFMDFPLGSRGQTWQVMANPQDFFMTMDWPEVEGPTKPLTHRFRIGADGQPEDIGTIPNPDFKTGKRTVQEAAQ